MIWNIHHLRDLFYSVNAFLLIRSILPNIFWMKCKKWVLFNDIAWKTGLLNQSAAGVCYWSFFFFLRDSPPFKKKRKKLQQSEVVWIPEAWMHHGELTHVWFLMKSNHKNTFSVHCGKNKSGRSLRKCAADLGNDTLQSRN